VWILLAYGAAKDRNALLYICQPGHWLARIKFSVAEKQVAPPGVRMLFAVSSTP